MSDKLTAVALLFIGFLALIGIIILDVLPVIYTYVLVNNDIETFKTLYFIAFIVSMILGIVEGVILTVIGIAVLITGLYEDAEGLITFLEATIIGILDIFYSVILLPKQFELVISFALNNITEPIPLATIKLIILIILGLGLSLKSKGILEYPRK